MARKKTTLGTLLGLPADYAELLESLKARIQQAQTKAMLSVNRELIRLYWDIGRLIVHRQEQEGWGKGVVDRLAGDIQSALPGIQGFSPRNVWRMRTFYLAYTQGVADLPQPVVGIDGVNLPQAVAEIPWGHNVWLLEKVKDAEQRLWYAAKTLEHGWSRAVLTVQIEGDLFGRQGCCTPFGGRCVDYPVQCPRCGGSGDRQPVTWTAIILACDFAPSYGGRPTLSASNAAVYNRRWRAGPVQRRAAGAMASGGRKPAVWYAGERKREPA